VRFRIAEGLSQRIALVAPDGWPLRADVMIECESGLLPSRRRLQTALRAVERRLTWPNGASHELLAEEPEAARTAARCRVVRRARAVAPRDAWDMLMLGLRLGPEGAGVVTNHGRAG